MSTYDDITGDIFRFQYRVKCRAFEHGMEKKKRATCKVLFPICPRQVLAGVIFTRVKTRGHGKRLIILS